MNLPDHLSASQINTFRQCPYKWYCDRKQRPTISVSDENMIFGRGVHDIIPIYYDKIEDFPNVSDMEAMLEVAFVEGSNWATDSQKAKFKRVKRFFGDFEVDRIRNKQKKPFFTEKRFTTKIFDDLPPFVYILDFYQKDIKKIGDWKTGRDSEMDESLMIQGKIYEIGLESEGYPVEEVIFYNLNSGVTPKLPRISNGWIHSIAKQMCGMIEGDRFPCKESYLCSWCPFILSCEFKNTCVWSI